MPAAPAFTRPSPLWFAALDLPLVALAVLATDQRRYDAVASSVPLPPRPRLKALLAGALALHVGEAIYAGRLARRHDLPAGRWARQTLVVGFPSTLALRRLVADR